MMITTSKRIWKCLSHLIRDKKGEFYFFCLFTIFHWKIFLLCSEISTENEQIDVFMIDEDGYNNSEELEVFVLPDSRQERWHIISLLVLNFLIENSLFVDCNWLLVLWQPECLHEMLQRCSKLVVARCPNTKTVIQKDSRSNHRENSLKRRNHWSETGYMNALFVVSLETAKIF